MIDVILASAIAGEGGGGGGGEGAVRYDATQSLSDAQKTRARGNIAAAAQADHASLDGRVNAVHQLVNYGYDTPGHLDAGTGAMSYTVDRNGTKVTLSTTSSTSGASFVKLTNDLDRVTTNQAIAAWSDGVQLIQGHVYLVRATLVSGTVAITGTNSPFLSIYDIGITEALTLDRNDDGECVNLWKVIRANANAAIVCLVTRAGTTYTNAVYEITLEDITGDGHGIGIRVSGADPVIAATPNIRYICTDAYVTSLSFTPSSSGICSVRFVSGTTPTVLTLPAGVKMPSWWNGCAASTTYEISIADGVYGAVGVWT